MTITAARWCFNPRLPRGRRQPAIVWSTGRAVSIHASRAGGDARCERGGIGMRVSIHASRAGGDRVADRHVPLNVCFNPRLPRGRRRSLRPASYRAGCFNPRLPRGRRRDAAQALPESAVSIHASRAGGDVISALPELSRSHVSIHASRAGGDDVRCRPRMATGRCFNPRLPRGRRRDCPPLPRTVALFQSTPPAREATLGPGHGRPGCPFQSTPPRGEATDRLWVVPFRHVSIHASRAGGDVRPGAGRARRSVSIHASRAGGDHESDDTPGWRAGFQSTPPAREATTTAT